MMSNVWSRMKTPKVNEYGYNAHKKPRAVLRKDNPWLYVFVIGFGLLLSYTLVNLSM